MTAPVAVSSKTDLSSWADSRKHRVWVPGVPDGTADGGQRSITCRTAPAAPPAGQLDILLLDDLVYLPQGTDESEALFTLIAERYERRPLGTKSNQVLSEWERIIANPTATAAAIDRVVHHSAHCLNKNVTFTRIASPKSLPNASGCLK